LPLSLPMTLSLPAPICLRLRESGPVYHGTDRRLPADEAAYMPLVA
jgi:hypothetical protein